MRDEDAFLRAMRIAPDDRLTRLVYADWLDERDDPRGQFLRLHWALTAAAPDHPERTAAEAELGLLRVGCSPDWLAVVEPERVRYDPDRMTHRACRCINEEKPDRRPTHFHTEAQDTGCGGWKRLLDLIETAAADGREEFAPLRDLRPEERVGILTLPPSVGKLKAVKRLNLYGSCLVRLPPEVGEMTALEEFVPYTSYRLHWFPFEITRCQNLRDSTVSTRAVYGNYKHRPPFPDVSADAAIAPGRAEPVHLPLRLAPPTRTRSCSVCRRPFEDRREHRVWVSIRVATDVLPMLVNACSAECVAALPAPPENYVSGPHRGGPSVRQPARRY